MNFKAYDESENDNHVRSVEKIKKSKSTFADNDKPNKQMKRNKKKGVNSMKRYDSELFGSFDD